MIMHSLGANNSSTFLKIFLRINRCPCITRTRGASLAYLSFSHNSFLDINDLMALMGFAQGRIRLPTGISERQLGGMIGNSQDVTLTAKILMPLLVLLAKNMSWVRALSSGSHCNIDWWSGTLLEKIAHRSGWDGTGGAVGRCLYVCLHVLCMFVCM